MRLATAGIQLTKLLANGRGTHWYVGESVTGAGSAGLPDFCFV